MAFRAICMALVVAAVAAIYPDGHWRFSTKLTTSNFDETIKNIVDSDKTMMVRWIASEG